MSTAVLSQSRMSTLTQITKYSNSLAAAICKQMDQGRNMNIVVASSNAEGHLQGGLAISQSMGDGERPFRWCILEVLWPTRLTSRSLFCLLGSPSAQSGSNSSVKFAASATSIFEFGFLNLWIWFPLRRKRNINIVASLNTKRHLQGWLAISQSMGDDERLFRWRILKVPWPILLTSRPILCLPGSASAKIGSNSGMKFAASATSILEIGSLCKEENFPVADTSIAVKSASHFSWYHLGGQVDSYDSTAVASGSVSASGTCPKYPLTHPSSAPWAWHRRCVKWFSFERVLKVTAANIFHSIWRAMSGHKQSSFTSFLVPVYVQIIDQFTGKWCSSKETNHSTGKEANESHFSTLIIIDSA